MGQCDNFFKKGVPPRLEEQSGRVQPPRGGKTWETRKALRLLAGTHPVVAPRQPETPGLRLPQDSRGGAKSSYVTVLPAVLLVHSKPFEHRPERALQLRQWGRALKNASRRAFLRSPLPQRPFSRVFHFFVFFCLHICTLYNI